MKHRIWSAAFGLAFAAILTVGLAACGDGTVAVESVTLDQNTLSLEVGKTETLTATVAPDDATDKTVTWTTDNAEVATVANGTVTAVAVGETVITATAGDKTATCSVTVTPAVVAADGITLNVSALSLEVGKTETLTATVAPDNATDKTVTWTTDNAEVATVANGTVTAVAVGETVITAKTGDKSATCSIVVADKVLSTAEDLTAFAAEVNGGDTYADQTIALGADIDLTDTADWTPIGNGTRSGSSYTGNAFKGVLNGYGFTISGFTFDGTYGADDAFGLVGVLDGGTVTDIIFEEIDLNITDSECAGTAVGMVVNGGTVSDITVLSGSLTAVRGNGGIAGRMCKEGTIENCVNHAAVTGTGSGGNTGGIVGAAYYTEVGKEMELVGCVNYGEIKGVYGVGGIVGLCSANVLNCENHGSVSGSAASVSGIVAEQQNYGSVIGCVNTGDITNTSAAYGTGGIVGWVRYSGEISNYPLKGLVVVRDCSNSGKIDGGNDGGGIVGTVYNAALVENCLNTAESISGTTFAAGIVGNSQAHESIIRPTEPEIKDMLTVQGCCSTTELDAITGNCKDLYVYVNDQQAITQKDNFQTQEAWTEAGYGIEG